MQVSLILLFPIVYAVIFVINHVFPLSLASHKARQVYHYRCNQRQQYYRYH